MPCRASEAPHAYFAHVPIGATSVNGGKATRTGRGKKGVCGVDDAVAEANEPQGFGALKLCAVDEAWYYVVGQPVRASQTAYRQAS